MRISTLALTGLVASLLVIAVGAVVCELLPAKGESTIAARYHLKGRTNSFFERSGRSSRPVQRSSGWFSQLSEPMAPSADAFVSNNKDWNMATQERATLDHAKLAPLPLRASGPDIHDVATRYYLKDRTKNFYSRNITRRA